MTEAKLVDTGAGLVPEGEGWFVLNTKDARWEESKEFGCYTRWEGDGDARFKELGINVNVLEPGQPACMYHAEDAQEDFLVLAGEGTLIVEGEERPLKPWVMRPARRASPPWAWTSIGRSLQDRAGLTPFAAATGCATPQI